MRYRAIFLDAGGTLIHIDRRFVIDTIRQQGIPCEDASFIAAEREAKERIGALTRAQEGTDADRWRKAWASALAGLGCTGASAAAVFDAVRARHAQGRLWTRVEQGTGDALMALKSAGYLLGVVSNADGRIAQFLNTAGLYGPLDFIVDSAIVGVEKPNPRIFEIACERAGVAPSEALHVGDFYEIDVLGARAAGVHGLLVDPDGGSDGLDCDRIRGVADLPAWLTSEVPAD